MGPQRYCYPFYSRGLNCFNVYYHTGFQDSALVMSLLSLPSQTQIWQEVTKYKVGVTSSSAAFTELVRLLKSLLWGGGGWTLGRKQNCPCA
jgi:hypothetical protein